MEYEAEIQVLDTKMPELWSEIQFHFPLIDGAGDNKMIIILTIILHQQCHLSVKNKTKAQGHLKKLMNQSSLLFLYISSDIYK